jgi:hypothetical protein
MTLIKRIFTDLQRGPESGANLTKTGDEEIKTLPLMTLIKRIFTDLQRGPESGCESDKAGGEGDQNLTADDADQTDFH